MYGRMYRKIFMVSIAAGTVVGVLFSAAGIATAGM